MMAPKQPYLDPAEERRLVLRVLAYWQDIRGDRDFPAPEDIDEVFIGADWTHCALLALRGEGFELVRAGAALANPEQTVDGETALYPGVAVVIGELLQRMLIKKVPLSLGREFDMGGKPCLGRAIVLPLAQADGEIGHVLAAANWKCLDTGGKARP